jgi:4-hydroxy-3-polyprenylbenzoate decarboxylase
MPYRSTRQVVDDLRRSGRLIVVDDPIDPKLELAEIHRRVYRNAGPALLFTNVRGCSFPVASNLYGTLERARYIFRETFEAVQLAVRWKTDPMSALKQPWQLWRAPLLGWRMRPKYVQPRSTAVMQHEIRLSDLPAVTCWPNDGGPFVTLPQVLSQTPGSSAWSSINLGMYRVQLGGNAYERDHECGLHYQIHRGIGVHHSEALRRGVAFPVNVAVGGTPAMTLAAVMPLPEGLSELIFAGALAGHRLPLVQLPNRAPIYADADFCIVGEVVPDRLKPEGPFGDHLGYYAKVHEFPVLKVHKVYHRQDAIWPMTVVGRPPQEDTTFGELIHELTEPVIPTVLPGVRQVHAVDAAGVHPLLLAVGSERYTPYRKPSQPQELLTQACAILGQGQLSLAKYLWIIDGGDSSAPKADEIGDFLQHALARVDWRRDLHFLTRTTMDTLDYSGDGLNQGSKLIIAVAAGEPRRLDRSLPSQASFPESWCNPRLVMPGVVAIEGPPHIGSASTIELASVCSRTPAHQSLSGISLIVVCDDSDFAARSLDNFLWVTFTRSNPAVDVYGFSSFFENKHFGCEGSLVIDARSKPQHAPGLIEDPEIMARVDARAARGGELARYL